MVQYPINHGLFVCMHHKGDLLFDDGIGPRQVRHGIEDLLIYHSVPSYNVTSYNVKWTNVSFSSSGNNCMTRCLQNMVRKC